MCVCTVWVSVEGGGAWVLLSDMVGGPRTLVCLGESLSVFVQVLGFAR